MNLGEKYKKAWFDYMSNLDRETLPSLMDDKFELRSLTKGRQKTIESKQEILERISNIGTSIKLTPEVYHSSDDLLVISVLQEWDTGQGIVMWFVKFRDGKAIQQITVKGDPA
tara:strand:+ start:177 stop:515 length:339 start_codon:yes stop_codon:yes gene_type:complete